MMGRGSDDRRELGGRVQLPRLGLRFDDEQTAFVRLKRVGSADAAMARLRDAGLEATRMTELDMVTRTMVGRHPSPKRNLVVHGGLPWQ